jgi:mRNA interferase RelE/StbE
VAEYTITFARSARKELERLSATVISRVFPRIEALAQNPRPPSCRKIQGYENLWRIRVGDYRVIYQVFDDELVVDIVTVRHRDQAYRLR